MAEQDGTGGEQDGTGAERSGTGGERSGTGGERSGTGLEPWVREALRCPGCGGVLRDGTRADGSPEMVCTGRTCGLAYPVRDGIPVLLVDEAYPAAGTV